VVAALFFALLVGLAQASLTRESRLAMGTVVGITLIDAPPGAADAAYAAIEAGEAALSEWRPDSLSARLGRGEALTLPAAAASLFVFAEALRAGSGGLFNLGWRSRARLVAEGSQWRSSGPLDLGGLLKGYLVDEAAAALRAAGAQRFIVDAAGDLYASGDGPQGRGWWVTVEGPKGPVARVRLIDQALSTSGDHQQPGHIHRGDTGAPVTGDRLVSVVAPKGLVADGLATALFAGAPLTLASEWGAAAWVSQDGATQTVGPARTFRRP
jgi:thiamine biosynthesis lipoprotein